MKHIRIEINITPAQADDLTQSQASHQGHPHEYAIPELIACLHQAGLLFTGQNLNMRFDERRQAYTAGRIGENQSL